MRSSRLSHLLSFFVPAFACGVPVVEGCSSAQHGHEAGEQVANASSADTGSFAPNALWTDIPYYGSRGTYFADVTGDGKADTIVVNDDAITVRRSNGASFTPNEAWTAQAYYGSRGTYFADVDGDGKADAIVVNDDKVTVRRSTGTGFGAYEAWTEGAYYGQYGTFFADVDGDGRADAIVVNSNCVTVRRSTGQSFKPNESWTTNPYYGQRGIYFADVNGDKRADAIVVNNDMITVRPSNGSSFLPNQAWTSNPYYGSRGTYFADVDGDGKADAIVVNDDKVTVRRSMNGSFGPNEAWTSSPYYGDLVNAFADVNGDRGADAIVVNSYYPVVARVAPTPPPRMQGDMLRYNVVQQTSSHNAYETSDSDSPVQRSISLFDQLAYHHIRSLELDIHYHAPSGQETNNISPNFWIYHTWGDNRGPSCNTLNACLAEIAAFRRSQPNHEVITVWLEPKDTDWNGGQGPADLDGDLIRALGGDAIYTPRMLLDQCNADLAPQGSRVDTLQAAIAQCAFPTLDRLRGKVMFVVMQTEAQKDQNSTAATVDAYAGSDALARTAFVAYDPRWMDRRNAIFSNFTTISVYDGASALSNLVLPGAAGAIVTRVAENQETDQEFLDLRTDAPNHGMRPINHIATERVNGDKYTGARTRNANGWPFSLLPSVWVPTSSFPDDEQGITMVSASGNFNADRDSYTFAYTTNLSDDIEWTAAISAEGDNLDPALGCLMARQTIDPGSPFFAVCRPTGMGLTFVMYRLTPSDNSQIDRGFVIETLHGATSAKLHLRSDGSGHTCAIGSFSNDGGVSSWNDSAEHCFNGTLPLQGIAEAAHLDNGRRFFFGDVRRSGNEVSAADLTCFDVNRPAGGITGSINGTACNTL